MSEWIFTRVGLAGRRAAREWRTVASGVCMSASPGEIQVRSEADPKFLLKYTDVYVGEPSVEEDSYTWRDVTPFECRLRDCTYSAPIYVNVLYTRGKQARAVGDPSRARVAAPL